MVAFFPFQWASYIF